MKYLVQMMAMFSDVLIVLMAVLLFYSIFKAGSVLFALIAIVLLLVSYRTWKDTGSFIAWTKEGQQAFFTNWNKITKK